MRLPFGFELFGNEIEKIVRAETIKEIQDEWKASLSMQWFEDKLMGLK